MKIINPSIDDIIDNFLDWGICTITLSNDLEITGTFGKERKERGYSIVWRFIPLGEKDPIYINHELISIIQRHGSQQKDQK